jgi:hypothetical protein
VVNNITGLPVTGGVVLGPFPQARALARVAKRRQRLISRRRRRARAGVLLQGAAPSLIESDACRAVRARRLAPCAERHCIGQRLGCHWVAHDHM